MQPRQAVNQICLRVVVMALSFCHTQAQSSLDEIHVAPKPGLTKSEVLHSLATDASGVFRKTVELVLVPVTIMDRSHRIVTGLQQENFHLYEDKQPQRIKNFWTEDEPVSVGIILDVSGSMEGKIDRAKDAVGALLDKSNSQDEFFLMTFADQPTLLQDFTQKPDQLQSELAFVRPKGRTALFDAIVSAVRNMKKAQYRRKALLIISDGGDNRSRYTEKDVKSLLMETDVLAYSLGVFDREFRTEEERLGPDLLANLSRLTGGSAYVVDNVNSLPEITGHIALELRNQYLLGYAPSSSRRNGKWRKIKVRVALPRGVSDVHVQARTGYYGTPQESRGNDSMKRSIADAVSPTD